jgi:large conductance mechanosensitive channel
MKNFTKELKEFAMKGSVVDLAVGVIIGGAFGKVVTSLVSDIIMPPIGVLIGGIKFTDIVIPISDTVNINIGNFIQACFDFAVVAIAIFAMIKLINKMKRQKPALGEEPTPVPEDIKLLTEIRDSLKK